MKFSELNEFNRNCLEDLCKEIKGFNQQNIQKWSENVNIQIPYISENLEVLDSISENPIFLGYRDRLLYEDSSIGETEIKQRATKQLRRSINELLSIQFIGSLGDIDHSLSQLSYSIPDYLPSYTWGFTLKDNNEKRRKNEDWLYQLVYKETNSKDLAKFLLSKNC